MHSGLLTKAILMARTKGLWFVLQATRHHISEKYHERQLGITSSGFVKIEGTHDGVSCFEYEPVDYRSIIEMIDRLSVSEGEDVFVDYGSGMGRAVVVAATYPFRRVVGVEVSPELNAIAEKNIQRARGKLKCKDVQLVNEDARVYVPPNDLTVAYFFCPFSEEVIHKVVENIRLSFVENPREVTFLFVNPRRFELVIANNGWLVKKHEFCRWDGIRVVAYQNNQDL